MKREDWAAWASVAIPVGAAGLWVSLPAWLADSAWVWVPVLFAILLGHAAMLALSFTKSPTPGIPPPPGIADGDSWSHARGRASFWEW